MRFLHTSDWHIGRILFERSLLQDQEHVLEQFIDLVKQSQVDAVIIAGDVYDRAVPPREAVRLLDDVISRITMQIGVPVFVISGNHDSAERLGFGARIFSERRLRIVSSFSDMASPLELETKQGRFRLYGIPYFDPADVVVEKKDRSVADHASAMRYCIETVSAALDPSIPSVAVAHGFIAGGEESPDSERPLSIGGTSVIPASLFSPFAYTALGHLHRPQNITPTVRYAGSLLSYSFDEARGKKSISLVEIGKDRSVKVEEIQLKPLRDLRTLEGKLEEILLAGKSDARAEDFILVRREDDGPVLDPIGRLRTVYPNVLSVERTRPKDLQLNDASSAGHAAARKAVPVDEMFRRFFLDVTGKELEPSRLARVEKDLAVEE
jgi:exonuclease SbcD